MKVNRIAVGTIFATSILTITLCLSYAWFTVFKELNSIVVSSGDLKINSYEMTFVRFNLASSDDYVTYKDRYINGTLINTSISDGVVGTDNGAFSLGLYDPYAHHIYANDTDINGDFKTRLIIKFSFEVAFVRSFKVNIDVVKNTAQDDTTVKYLSDYVFFSTFDETATFPTTGTTYENLYNWVSDETLGTKYSFAAGESSVGIVNDDVISNSTFALTTTVTYYFYVDYLADKIEDALSSLEINTTENAVSLAGNYVFKVGVEQYLK